MAPKKQVSIVFTAKPGPNSGGDEFEIGKAYKISAESAARWIRRGVAIVASNKNKQ